MEGGKDIYQTNSAANYKMNFKLWSVAHFSLSHTSYSIQALWTESLLKNYCTTDAIAVIVEELLLRTTFTAVHLLK